MQWLDRWRALSSRIQELVSVATLTVEFLDRTGRNDQFSVVGKSLLPELDAVTAELQLFLKTFDTELPADARQTLADYLGKGWRGAGLGTLDLQALLPIAVFRSRFDFLVKDTEVAVRSLTELAFEHLRRLIAANRNVAAEWTQAFAAGETTCEGLGAAHLLAHGIWAFKVAGGGAATDLVFGDLIRDEMGTIQRTARALVLTEWKIVRDTEGLARKSAEARAQASLYAAGVLGSLEVKRTRYIVLVTEQEAAPPEDVEQGGALYRHIVLPVRAEAPSTAARRLGRNAG